MNIYHFLKEYKKAVEPVWLKEAFAGRDAGEVITDMALSERDELCGEAVDPLWSAQSRLAENGSTAMDKQ